MENAKTLAELIDTRLARHYELDDNGKKKVRHLLKKKNVDTKSQILALGVNGILQVQYYFYL